MAEFKDILKYLREKENMTQRELAVKLNVTAQTISNYEKGIRMPDFVTEHLISEIFGVSLDFLHGTEKNGELNKINWEKSLHPEKFVSDSESDIACALYDRNEFIVEMIKETQEFNKKQMDRLLEYARLLNGKVDDTK